MHLLITNLEKIITGKLNEPTVEGDSISIKQNVIMNIGNYSDMNTENDTIIDASGMIAIPGLIDCHVHPWFGDIAPFYKAYDWIIGYSHGGVTAMISAGQNVSIDNFSSEENMALAIFSRKFYEEFTFGNVKVLGGIINYSPYLSEADLFKLSKLGINRVGVVDYHNCSSINELEEFFIKVKYSGLKSLLDCSLDSSKKGKRITPDIIAMLKPDVACHINGAPVSLPKDEISQIINRLDCMLEVVETGNYSSAVDVIQLSLENDMLHRILLGTNTPSPMGLESNGTLMLMQLLTSFTDLSAEQVICLSTGNIAQYYNLPSGFLEKGRIANVVLIDAANGSAAKNGLQALEMGEKPAIALVIIDGVIKVSHSKNSPPPRSKYIISKKEV